MSFFEGFGDSFALIRVKQTIAINNGKISNLRSQRAALVQRIAQLQAYVTELTAMYQKEAQWTSGSEYGFGAVGQTEQITSAQSEINAAYSQIDAIDKKIIDIEADNDRLQNMADELVAQETPTPVEAPPVLPSSTLPTVESSLPITEEVPSETQIAGMSPWILILLAGVGATMIFGRKKGRGAKRK
jgi:hypothetical protein